MKIRHEIFLILSLFLSAVLQGVLLIVPSSDWHGPPPSRTHRPPQPIKIKSFAVDQKAGQSLPTKVLREKRSHGDDVEPKPQKPETSKLSPVSKAAMTEKLTRQKLRGGAEEIPRPVSVTAAASLERSIQRLRDMVRKNDEEWMRTKAGCRHWYSGVGVTVAGDDSERVGESSVISDVYLGYAAEAAGVRSRDILTVPGGLLRGLPGTEVRIQVRRPGPQGQEEAFAVTLVRERICLDRDGDIMTKPQ